VIKLFTFLLVLLLSPYCYPLPYQKAYDVYFKVETVRYLPEKDWRWLKAQCYQESLLDPLAVSHVGAMGICQFMPYTWRDVRKRLGYNARASPFNAAANIKAAAFYMRQLRRGWSSKRLEWHRHNLALASYNAGFGNILKAQKRCNGALEYPAIIKCLPDVTGDHSNETIQYVERIQRWYRSMQSLPP